MMEPKRILIFSLAYHPFVGGAEVAVKEITDRIGPAAYTFDMVTLRFDRALPKVERIGNVTVHRIGLATRRPTPSDLRGPLHRLNKFLYQIRAHRAAVKLHRERPFDGVWAVMAHSAGVPAYLFSRAHPEVSYLLTLQEGDPLPRIERTMLPLWPLFTRAFENADGVQAISQFLGRWARRRGFRGDVAVVPNGVDLALFGGAPSPESVAAARERMGKRDGGALIVSASRLVPKNGLDDLVRALPLLTKNITLALIGTGPEEGRLGRLARGLGVRDRVRFLGFVPHAELPAYVKAADIFARPSLSEGMGNAFIEAFATGVPVIATQEGGIADFLFDPALNPEHPPTGRVVGMRDPEGIARQISAYFDDADMTKQITANARRLAERYDWGIIAKRMRDECFDAVFKNCGKSVE